MLSKKIEYLEFVQGVSIDIIDSLKNSGTQYLVIFDDSCEKICNSKAFVNIATSRRHRGLSTIYFRQNLLPQSKLGETLSSKTCTLFSSNVPIT